MTCLFEELRTSNRAEKPNARCRGDWPLLGAGLLNTRAQLGADAPVTKLEEGLDLEKDVQLSTTLLASGLVHKLGEQDSKVETLGSQSANLGEGTNCLGLSSERL